MPLESEQRSRLMKVVVSSVFAARAQLVRRYRAHPQMWPDGIDGMDGSGNEQWYRGHEHEWTEERIKAILDGKSDPLAKGLSVNAEPVNKPTVNVAVVNVPEAVERKDRARADMAGYMREWRKRKTQKP
jgi:hypothetical protein